MDSRILHNALLQINSYKVYEGIIFTQTEKYEFKDS